MNINLPINRFTSLENFGHSLRAPAYLYRPGNAEEIAVIFKFAKENGLTITLRGAGRSYNDAALNGGGIVLDLQRMNRILDWDPARGLVRAEPGVYTSGKYGSMSCPTGWWPPVVSGTMTTTLGAASVSTFMARTISEWVPSANM